MVGNKSFLFSKGQKSSKRYMAVCLPLLILASFLVTEFRTKAQEKKDENQAGTISGCVKVNGKPTSGIEIALLRESYNNKEKALAITKTDENGCYLLSNISPDHYWLKVLAPEYINADQKIYLQRVRSVAVNRDAVDDANFDLVTGGVISGKVTDADGNPIAGEFLALAGVWEHQSETTYPYPSYRVEYKTNADGTYKIVGVQPGRYLVSIGEDIARLSGSVYYKNDLFGAQGRVGSDYYYEQTFYPGITDKTKARIIEVTPGIEVQDVNITVGKVLKSFSASGRAIEAETGKPIRNQDIQIIHTMENGGSNGVIADDETDENGYFHISGLIPGHFTVSVYFRGDTPLVTKPLDFEITSADLEGLELKAHKGYSISGTVQIENGNKKAMGQLSELELKADCRINEDHAKRIFRDTKVKSDGSFTLNGLYTGEIEIALWSSQHFLLKSAEYVNAEGKTEALPVEWSDRTKIPLSNADVKTLRLILVYRSASIKGEVKIVGGKLDSEAKLSASITRKLGQGIWTTNQDVDVNGNFVIDGLDADGEYEIYIRINNLVFYQFD